METGNSGVGLTGASEFIHPILTKYPHSLDFQYFLLIAKKNQATTKECTLLDYESLLLTTSIFNSLSVSEGLWKPMEVS